MRKFKCIVCGYIHEGDAPPARCPQCGAPKSKFVELIEEESQAEEDDNDDETDKK